MHKLEKLKCDIFWTSETSYFLSAKIQILEKLAKYNFCLENSDERFLLVIFKKYEIERNFGLNSLRFFHVKSVSFIGYKWLSMSNLMRS